MLRLHGPLHHFQFCAPARMMHDDRPRVPNSTLIQFPARIASRCLLLARPCPRSGHSTRNGRWIPFGRAPCVAVSSSGCATKGCKVRCADNCECAWTLSSRVLMAMMCLIWIHFACVCWKKCGGTAYLQWQSRSILVRTGSHTGPASAGSAQAGCWPELSASQSSGRRTNPCRHPPATPSAVAA